MCCVSQHSNRCGTQSRPENMSAVAQRGVGPIAALALALKGGMEGFFVAVFAFLETLVKAFIVGCPQRNSRSRRPPPSFLPNFLIHYPLLPSSHRTLPSAPNTSLIPSPRDVETMPQPSKKWGKFPLFPLCANPAMVMITQHLRRYQNGVANARPWSDMSSHFYATLAPCSVRRICGSV